MESTIPLLPDGRVNKSQEESSRDQTQVLMMILSLRRRPDITLMLKTLMHSDPRLEMLMTTIQKLPLLMTIWSNI